MPAQTTLRLIALSVLSVAGLCISCSETLERRRGATEETCFVDNDCRSGLICLAGQCGISTTRPTTDANLSDQRDSAGVSDTSPPPADTLETPLDVPGVPDIPDPSQGERRTFRLDTLNISSPEGLSVEVGIIQQAIEAGETHILLQVVTDSFEALEQPAEVLLGPATPIDANSYAFLPELVGITEGVLDNAGPGAFQLRTTAPMERWNLLTRLGGASTLIIPIRNVVIPIAGVASERIQKSELAGALNIDDAKAINLPDIGGTLADRLVDIPLELDLDGDGLLDSWEVRGEFTGAEVEFVP
ncbi:MAG: hypothetical protein AAFX99_04560 [Myxococcota bacterium]